MLYAGSLFDDKGNLNASLGAHELEIEVAQAGEDGASAKYRFSTRAALIDNRRGGGRPRGSSRGRAAKGLKTRLNEVGGQIFNPEPSPPKTPSPPYPSFPFYCMLTPTW